ncbi:hypothetical protein [Desulfitobacterium sp.]|uniref:hypothetical protein n=1 Tax=Desulfitobacterium sp. TaxID=49981 RepID=UPI002B221545|nr:hypothetical protein [Desulfitobacterium sp.]MEA4901571.1 hypothetical protein [Desulfitobacterium sp.]
MFDFLERFEKRMEFAAVVDSIVNRINKNSEIEQQFAPQEIDNLLFSILVFIMERTLAEDHDCTLESIAGFLSAVLPAYGKHFSAAQADALARYLVKDILQNKGVKRTYKVMDYAAAGFREQTVRLIADQVNEHNQVIFELTRQGYDFLFRTKEVDDELGFQIEEMRLQMQIEKHYYKEAIGQSRELVRMLIQKRRELAQFEAEIRGDLSAISGQDYDALMRGVDAMLAEEYGTMQKIEAKVRRAQEQLDEEESRRGRLDEKAQVARTEVLGILANVRRALSLQRQMLIQCEKMKKLYLHVLEDAIAYHATRRYNMEDEILAPLAACTIRSPEAMDRLSRGLLAPLFLPQLSPILNLKLIYDRQAKIREVEREQTVEEEAVESEQAAQERLAWRNRAHVRVVNRLLAFAATHPAGFSLEMFYNALRQEEGFAELCRERLLFLAMLRLFEAGSIDLALWKEQHDEWSEDCAGEFDLSYCLGRIGRLHPDFYGLRCIRIKKAGRYMECTLPPYSVADGLTETPRLTMDDLLFEVEIDEGNTADFENPVDGR